MSSQPAYNIYVQSPEGLRLLLIVPVDVPRKFCTKPLKWLRFATYAVVGCRGVLRIYKDEDESGETAVSEEANGGGDEDTSVDMDNEQPDEHDLVYIPDDVAQFRFMDKEALNPRFNSRLTQLKRRSTFPKDLRKRDNDMCVITRTEQGKGLQACHLIPHAKGHNYMERFCQWRNENELTMVNVDDIKNGCVMISNLHTELENGYLAVLPTPNFALEVDEVLPPGNPVQTQMPDDIIRFTPHEFGVRKPNIIGDPARKTFSTDLGHPQQMVNGWPKDWPPRFLWDAIYGLAVLKSFGVKDTVDVLNEAVHRACYPGKINRFTGKLILNEPKRKLKKKKIEGKGEGTSK